MFANFNQLNPEIICEAAERLGGRATGRIMPLNAMENRVFEVGMEDETLRIVKFYRNDRWTNENILAEHRFLAKAISEELNVAPPLVEESSGDSLIERDGLRFAVFPKKRGRLEAEL